VKGPRYFSDDLRMELAAHSYTADQIEVLNDPLLIGRIRQSLTGPPPASEVREQLKKLDDYLRGAVGLIEQWERSADAVRADPDKAQEYADLGAHAGPKALGWLNNTALVGRPERPQDRDWHASMWPVHIVGAEVVRLAAMISARALAAAPGKSSTKRTRDGTGRVTNVPTSSDAVAQIVEALRPTLQGQDVVALADLVAGESGCCWVLSGPGQGYDAERPGDTDWRRLPIAMSATEAHRGRNLLGLAEIMFRAAMGRQVSAYRSVKEYLERYVTGEEARVMRFGDPTIDHDLSGNGWSVRKGPKEP
jgi:hypothetical protein